MNLNKLYTDDDNIIVNKHGIGYGSFFYKVRTKKFFEKWSRRVFIVSNKEIQFFKMRKNKRYKKKIIYFTHLCKLGGLECCMDMFHKTYYKFTVSYDFGEKIKTYKFKSYNTKGVMKLYEFLNTHICNKAWGSFRDV